jgi:UDP-2-acetamido-3-amino-2,3-dideoxy-glucuronate N-acetyltransferase
VPAGSFIDPSADVSAEAAVGHGTHVWGLAQVRESAQIGVACVIGRGAYVDAGVVVGDNVKVQNNALLYSPAVVEHGAFIGPAAVLTNDRHPRAVTAEGRVKGGSDWDRVGVLVRAGASIGAGAVCVAPLTVGRWALVAAGAVALRDVPDHALVAGNPARQVGWVGRAGHKLQERGDHLFCPVTAETYRFHGDVLVSD